MPQNASSARPVAFRELQGIFPLNVDEPAALMMMPQHDMGAVMRDHPDERRLGPVGQPSEKEMTASQGLSRDNRGSVLVCHIVRVRSRTSLAILGRPGVPCWLSCRQWSRKRWRCQAMTVWG